MDINDSTVPAGSAPVESLTTDVCVVGGGMAGICTAIAAARRSSQSQAQPWSRRPAGSSNTRLLCAGRLGTCRHCSR